MSMNEKFIKSIKEQLPAWRRAFSLAQLKASSKLESSLRDDGEQGTTYRIWECLFRLGLRPVPKHNQISIIVNLARGNPLAFLYFLMEAYYKTDSKDYSPAEQLIMSAICHIDLPITIIELDRLLPPGNMSHEKETKKQGVPCASKEQKQKKRNKNVNENKSPYFQKQPRPVITVKTYKSVRLPYKLHLPYQKRIQNFKEAHRWFAEYDLQPGKRIVKKIINDELSKLYDKIDAIQFPIIDQNDGSGYGGGLGEDSEDDCQLDIRLCDFHVANKKLEQSKYLVEAKQRCLKLVNLASQQKEDVRKLVTQQLEKDINFYLKTYGKNWNSQWYFVPIIDKNCEVCLQKVQVPRVANLLNPNVKQFKCDDDDMTIPLHVNRKFNSDESEELDVFPATKVSGNFGRQEDCKPNTANINTISPKYKTSPCLQKKFVNLKEISMFGKPGNQGEHNKFFEAPKAQPNMPYCFHHKSIFQNQLPTVNKEPSFLEKTVRVLYEDTTSNGDESDRSTLDKATSFSDLSGMQKINVMSAIEHCVHNILNKGLRKVPTQVEEEKGTLKTDKKYLRKSVKRDFAAEDELKNYFHQDSFDPNNDKLMRSMLEAALKVMSKDRRFVLATFPDCHKLPSLLAWVKRRYGLMYRDLSLREFEKIKYKFVAVANMNNHFLPKVSTSLQTRTMTYDYVQKVQNWADCVKRKFFAAVDSAVLEQNRLLWDAIGPYQFRSLSLRRTFFAYLPSDNRNIPHYNIWH